MLVGLCLPVGAFGQSTEPHKDAKSTSHAEITKFFIEEPRKGSGYETGPLHIIYEDGSEFVKTLPPLEASSKTEIVFNSVGFSHVQLAADRQTLGWTIDVENCCTSYSIPMSVVVLRHKQVLHTFAQGQMVWSWMFFQGGKKLAVVFGTTHGLEVGDYRLYDVNTDRLISEIRGDEDTQSLGSNAPKWAKLLEERLHNN